ncbi:MAG: hypothetical protein IT331_14585 [Anaerolineae bacterium]|nr:hypothetical protein [Anaerolineae bacterium]
MIRLANIAPAAPGVIVPADRGDDGVGRRTWLMTAKARTSRRHSACGFMFACTFF